MRKLLLLLPAIWLLSACSSQRDECARLLATFDNDMAEKIAKKRGSTITAPPTRIAVPTCGEAGTKRRSPGRRRLQACPEANELLLKSKERLEAVAMNLLGDICEPGPLLTPEA